MCPENFNQASLLRMVPNKMVMIALDSLLESDETDLRPLEDWMGANRIMVTWDLPLEIQRRS